MALRKQPLPIQFSGGIETKQDSKQISVTKLQDLQNATFIKQTTLQKRNGYKALSKQIDNASSQYSNAVGLAARDNELITFADNKSYSYRPSAGTWANSGEVGSLVTNEVPIARTGTDQTAPDHATNQGVTLVAWQDSRGGVYCSVVEELTGRILLSERLVDLNGVTPRCIAVDTVLHLIYANPTAGQLWILVFNPSTPEVLPTPHVLTTDLNPGLPIFDACTTGGTGTAKNSGLILWCNLSGGLSGSGGQTIAYIHASGVLGSPVTGLPSVASYNGLDDIVGTCLAVTYNKLANDVVAMMWSDSGDILRVRFVSASNLASQQSTAVVTTDSDQWVRCALEFGDSVNGFTNIWWIGETNQGLGPSRPDLNYVECGQVQVAAGIILTNAETRKIRGHCLASRAFYDNGNIYACVSHAVKFFTYVALVRISAATFGTSEGGTSTIVLGRFLPGLSTGQPSTVMVTSVNPINPDSRFISRQHSFCQEFRIQLSSQNNDQFSEVGIKLETVDFDNDNAYQWAQLGRGLYLSGAILNHYDGNRWAESDFHCAPDVSDGVTIDTVHTDDTGDIQTGTYGYKIMYEEIDAQGELHRGATSIEFNVVMGSTGGTGGSVDLELPTYRLSNKRMTRISVFRTPVNQTGDPDSIPFYRVTSTDVTVTTGSNCYVSNDPTVDAIKFTDGLSDAALIDREPLYTNGGVLSNTPSIYAGGALAGGKSRLFWTDPSDPQVVRYSQQLDQGDAAVETSLDLSIRVDPYGGAIVGLGVLDDAIIVYCQTAIYVFGGPGPDANPNIGTDAWTPPALVTSDVGCKSPNSISQTPLGHVFQSTKGIFLLGRDRQVVSIGDPVYAYNDQLVSRATLLPDRHQIVFLTASGRTLLYDYEHQQWSTYTNHEGIDALTVDDSYYYLRTDGRVFQETPGIYKDDNLHIPMVIETAWIKMSGYLQGWQKIIHAKFIGSYLSSHKLRIRYRIDYQDAYSSPIDIDVDATYTPDVYGSGTYGSGTYGAAMVPNTVYQEGIHINKRCQSISFKVQDLEASSNFGASFELSELLLTGGVIGTDFKPGGSRSN